MASAMDGSSTAGAGETRDVITSSKGPPPVGAYAMARRAGGLLLLASIGPRKKGTKDIPGVTLDAAGHVVTYDIAAQIHSCFQNVRDVLEEAGSSWDKIVDVTVYMTDFKRDFEVYNRLWAEYFPPGPNSPVRTTIEINKLPQAGNAPINFDVKVIASA